MVQVQIKAIISPCLALDSNVYSLEQLSNYEWKLYLKKVDFRDAVEKALRICNTVVLNSYCSPLLVTHL